MHVFLLLLTVVGLLSSMSRKLVHKSKWSWINQWVDSVLGLVFSYLKLGKLRKTRKRYMLDKPTVQCGPVWSKPFRLSFTSNPLFHH